MDDEALKARIAREFQEQAQSRKIWDSFQMPMLRYGDVPGSDILLQQRLLNPEDLDLVELHGLLQNEQLNKAVTSGNPFHANAPPRGSLPPCVPGRIPLATLLPTQDVLSIGIESSCKNILVIGPIGQGKTNYLRVLIAAVLEAGNALVVVFDRKKGETVDCHYLASRPFLLYVLYWHELQLAMLQPFPDMSTTSFCNVMIQMLAKQLDLFASRRLMLDTLSTLFKRKRVQGSWPTLSEWIGMIEGIRANALSRLGGYREATLYALTSIYRELGDVVDHASSNFFEQVFSQKGCCVVLTSGLSVEAESLLASLFMAYAFYSRENVHPAALSPVLFILDDALPLVRGSAAQESEGGVNPLSTWAFLGRSRKMGIVCAAQNFSVVSPVFKNNCSTCLCFGSWGRDAEELARYLHLSSEQAAMLPALVPGQVIAVARSIWPHAVFGLVPEIV